jgi:hypothetical protein
MRKKKKEVAEHPAARYLEKIGGGLSLLGLGGTFPFPQFYWYGVGAFYLGLFALSVGVLLENWGVRWRLVTCGVWLSFAILVSLKAVFVSAPLEIESFAHIGDYADGVDVYGIKWEPGMSELRLVISNHTARDYDDVDINFVPDVPTRKITQVTNLPDVALSIARQAGTEEVADTEMTTIDANGKVLAGGPTEIYASGSGFRMRCLKIPKHTTVELLAALVTPPQLPRTGLPPRDESKVMKIINLAGDPRKFAGPKKLSASVCAQGQYFVLNRPHSVDYTDGVR